jgi:hypothetical protein
MDRALVQLVWRRARERCEYCQMPQAFDDLIFQIDHIIARSHGGREVADNLCLACFAGNHFKGTNVPASTAKPAGSCSCSIHVASTGRGTFVGPARASLEKPLPAGQPWPLYKSTSTIESLIVKCSCSRASFRPIHSGQLKQDRRRHHTIESTATQDRDGKSHLVDTHGYFCLATSPRLL